MIMSQSGVHQGRVARLPLRSLCRFCHGHLSVPSISKTPFVSLQLYPMNPII